MNVFLITTCETYRAESEADAKKIIDDAKNNNLFVLAKYTNEYKERKLKGEVVDSYYKVTLTKKFTEEKNPSDVVAVNYKSEGYFPAPSEEDDYDE